MTDPYMNYYRTLHEYLTVPMKAEAQDLFNASIFRWSFISEDQMNIRAENEFSQSGNSYWMHLLTRIFNNNGRYCWMSVLSLYFYFWYIIDDFTKKNEFFLPKSDRLIHLLISIVNNKCKYPWLYFPLIEASFSQRKLMIRQKKRNFIYPVAPVHWICS